MGGGAVLLTFIENLWIFCFIIIEPHKNLRHSHFKVLQKLCPSSIQNENSSMNKFLTTWCHLNRYFYDSNISILKIVVEFDSFSFRNQYIGCRDVEPSWGSKRIKCLSFASRNLTITVLNFLICARERLNGSKVFLPQHTFQPTDKDLTFPVAGSIIITTFFAPSCFIFRFYWLCFWSLLINDAQ